MINKRSKIDSIFTVIYCEKRGLILLGDMLERLSKELKWRYGYSIKEDREGMNIFKELAYNNGLYDKLFSHIGTRL